MKNYISVKQVKAEPCTAWENCKGHKIGDTGYKIYYPDGYVSWCPSDIFEQQYLETEKTDEITNFDIDNLISSISFKNDYDKKRVRGRAVLKNGYKVIEIYPYPNTSYFGEQSDEQLCVEQIRYRVQNFLYFLLYSARYGFKQEDK